MMEYLRAFVCGGLLCAIGQVFIDKTNLTPARILTGYVVAGVVLQAAGVYQYVVDWGGAGATVPLTGFGYCLAKGVKEALSSSAPHAGTPGQLLSALTTAFSGGLQSTAGGIAAAVFFGLIFALLVKPKEKR